MGDPRGSIWRRWDPHLHAPGTVLNDGFGGPPAFDDYIDRLESSSPPIEAVGVTDYLATRTYQDVLRAQSQGRLRTVGLLFPNVEMRLSIDTKRAKGINLHILVSPDDDDHLEQLDRFLRRLTFEFRGDKYSCDEDDLIRLGRSHDPDARDNSSALRAGVNQFRVDFRQLRSEYQDSAWMMANTLVAVAGGSTDGTSGLQSKDAGFAATRKEIERFAHIIFSSSDQQARFWRGEGSATPAELKREYAGMKPCLHGSDAHSLDEVGVPDLGRNTWIKGDTRFETLRQACLEPISRVYIGESPPELATAERSIRAVRTPGVAWLAEPGVELNPGLVAIIGARGSGKTALADVLSHGGGNPSALQTPDSFLTRAREHLREGQVELEWSDDELTTRGLYATPDDFESEVHYLSQQFVERLCSSEGASDELISEIEKVVFAAHDPASRMEATAFDQLLEARTGDTRRKREHLRARLDRISEDVLEERIKKEQLPGKRRALAELERRTDGERQRRDKIVRKGEQQRGAYYERLRLAIEARERSSQRLDHRRQKLKHLLSSAERYRESVFPQLHADLRAAGEGLGISDEEWSSFSVTFTGDPEEVVEQLIADIDVQIDRLIGGDESVSVTISSPEEELGRAALESLRDAFARVGEEIGIDRQNAQRLKVLNARIAANEIEVDKLKAEVEEFAGADERLRSLAGSRAQCYEEYFELVIAEEEILRDLYRPLEAHLAESSETVGRLRLVVVRDVAVEEWAERGEELLDLRKTGTFKGRGALARFAREELAEAWESGAASDVSQAMSAFRSEYDRAILEQAPAERSEDPDSYQQWTLDVGRWLYSTDHIDVRYSFEYEGLPLSHLSPGTRGIVLLLLYLALDVEDARPLIIDQPEENLDPRSVFAELVELFRTARGRRQVVIVTHNANLVVNTDVDQVIVASCDRRAEGEPPLITYRSGALEDDEIRAEVCDILEGGEEAFKERARRLRVPGF